jgi:hypothetical protein
MAFFTPEIAAPYRDLKFDYQGEDERVLNDALNQARQIGAQQAARGGMSSPRGTALNTYNRLASDILTSRAQRERENRLNYTKTMASLPMQPSAISQIGSPLMEGIGKGMGPAVGKGLVGGLAKLWGSGTGALTNAYESLRGGPSAEDVSGYASYTDVPTFDFSGYDAAPAGSMDYGAGEEAMSGILGSGGGAAESGSALGDWLKNAWGGVSSIFGW